MELVLNVAWFIIAATSYALLFRSLTSRSAERNRGPSPFQREVALSSVLLILFPVISLTDDLHEMQAALEESSSSGAIMERSVGYHQLTTVSIPHQLVYIVSSVGVTIGLAAFGNTATQRTVLLSSGLWLTSLGRAPPSFFVILIR
jgi:hypothetical protein